VTKPSTLRETGKTPVEVNDYPGFVANRILMPMINEAIETLYNKVAGVYEIDTVMKLEWVSLWGHYN
jgi:3-hydroxybutyryl-CoA dehydrogenase